ncbi:Cu(I)-responsive transcriptional regulator [Rubricella aquisinus]|uniref:Cu(I)-responsive transcriptional regulator n=1 Tax=Rubricella aquisinus TaxID=2028108 RepID=A0A840WTM4_9RHOB|nr:Cu(I)-responsive transcriptional regulator [Rubricella aquisinus]MBB5517032.1 Cu(I)-responsive transcriptional regulator [Rubricella aquisinus]
MNISDAANAAGLPAKTLRYYEDIGLITPGRGANGYRDYSPEDVHRLTFLGRARSLGFSIEDCRALLSLYADEDRSSSDVKQIAQRHLDDISEKMRGLAEMQATLQSLVSACAGDKRPNCPILSSLGQPKTTKD